MNIKDIYIDFNKWCQTQIEKPIICEVPDDLLTKTYKTSADFPTYSISIVGTSNASLSSVTLTNTVSGTTTTTT